MRRAALAAMLGGAAAPIHALAADAAASAAQPATDQSQLPIVVTAPLFHDIQPERVLDEDAIESYGASTIDGLLGEIQVELGEDGEAPLIIVNGERINDISEIGALPVEVLRTIQLLPRGSALRAGGSANQRVIAISLKRRTRTATLTAAHKLATEGDWNAERGEAILTSVKGDTRANLALRVRDESSLFESERAIVQPATGVPYALGGNIIGYPAGTGEIDPLLSQLAGAPLAVLPIPPIANPTLAQLATTAGQGNLTDVGAFRTLRPETRNYDLNGTVATRLAPWLTSSATLHLGRNRSNSLRGLPAAIFILSPENIFSPFSRDVGLALYGAPLRHRSVHQAGDGNATFNARWGAWTGNLNVRHSETSDIVHLQRRATFGAIALDDAFDPFTTDLSLLVPLQADRISARSAASLAGLTLTGPALDLPAGPVQATLEGRLASNRLRSQSSFSTMSARSFRRDEQSVRGALEVPIASRDNHVMAGLGELSASLEFGRAHYSDAGSVSHYTYGLTWEPRPAVRLHADVDQTDLPPPIQTLGSPVTFTPDVRIYDPLTGKTADVTEISGGNPLLEPQSAKVRTVAALVKLVPRLNLQLNAQYSDSDLRNFVASLPETSAAVMLAFPERFVRDATGELATIDLRPVNFKSHREKKLRWGLSMNARLGGGLAPGAKSSPAGRAGRGTYLQLTANHTMVLLDKILIRPGLDPVDLLEGGVIGLPGGRLRHQVDGTAALTAGGFGLRVGVAWRGPSTLESRIGGVTDTLHFSPLLGINVRAFVDAKRLVPSAGWARGLRLSLDVTNLSDQRQSVRDSFGNRPLPYQPAYRDSIGRTIEIELRKVF